MISTAEESWAGLRVELNGPSLEIKDTEDGGAELGFSAQDRLTWWETDGDGVLTLGQDCGRYLLFQQAEMAWVNEVE